jgi:hypothetical protein
MFYNAVTIQRLATHAIILGGLASTDLRSVLTFKLYYAVFTVFLQFYRLNYIRGIGKYRLEICTYL